MYGGRLLYGDIHPGNFFNLEDGRLEVGYFGMLVELADTLRELLAGPAAHHR